MQKHRKVILLVSILIVSLSCRFLSGQETPTSVTATGLPSQTETLVATVPAVTDTPLAPAGTPAPTSLNPTGPYVVYGGTRGVWISNPDGSFLTQVTNLDIGLHDLRRLISPQGDRMALVVAVEGLDLLEIKIPSGETKTLAHLLDITSADLSSNPLSAKAFAAYAIRDYDDIAWQPGEGKLLAFMGAVNGPTSDLYVYDTDSGKITQLTDGPSQGVFPNWSPDGKYILHYGVSWRGPFGGAILGHDHLDGVWAVREADGEVITQPTPKSVAIPFVGWQDDSHYITYDSDINSAPCVSKNLRSVDVVTGKATPIMAGGFSYGIARSTENQAFLFEGSAGCPGEGTFLLLPGQTTPTRLLDQSTEVSWLPESKVFFAYPEALLSSDGGTRYDPPAIHSGTSSVSTPAVSTKGYQAWKVIENRQTRIDVKVPGSDWQKIFDGNVGKLIWDPVSGETLLFTGEDGFLYAASYPDFTPRQMGKMEGVNQIIWLR